MSKINVEEVKRKIISIIQEAGPSLPLPIAKKIQMQPMFTSAILSELLNEKRVKTSSLKVGSSPLYYIPGQEEKLEGFADNLTGGDKEAYLKLKDNKLLEDTSQDPRIRVSLRGLKDFAIPMQINGKLYWKYFTASNEKIKSSMEDEGNVAIGERTIGQKILQDIKKEEIKSKEQQYEEVILSSEKKQESEKIETQQSHPVEKEETKPIQETKAPEIKGKMKKLTEKDIFLENVKRILYSKNIEILETIFFDKKQVIAKARVNVDQNCLLFFFDKKRPDEKDLIKAYKKATEYRLPYYIVTQSEAQKKLKETAEVYKHLLGMDSVE